MHKAVKSFCVIFITTVFLGLFISPALAADKCLTTDILADVTGTYNATFQLQLGDQISLFASGIILNRNSNGLFITGYAAGGGMVYYLDEALDGFYASGGLSVISVTIDGVTIPGYGFIGSVGYKKNLDNGLTLSGNVGLNAFNEFYLGLEIGYTFKKTPKARNNAFKSDLALY